LPVSVLYGTGCDTGGEDGDGVVVARNARLTWARDIAVNGSCAGTDLLHVTMLDLQRQPTFYKAVRKLLEDLQGAS
jgi:hypothetical protein